MKLSNAKLSRKERGNAPSGIRGCLYRRHSAVFRDGRRRYSNGPDERSGADLLRDAAHMYARGVDFSQVANQNILVNLATGTGMTVSGGNGVIVMSQIVKVYQADCTAAGLTSGQCANLNQLVFINRMVTGNSGLRPSNYGTPPSAYIDSLGNIAASDYLTRSNLVVTGGLTTELTNSGLTLNDGDIAYLTEFYESMPDLSFLGASGSGGVYAKAIF